MAQAIRDPRVMTAIKAGKHGRIGFAVFAWHHGQFPAVVPWMIIASPQDAEIAARAIEARQLMDLELEGRAQVEWYIGRLTDLSQAIEYADAMLLTAPYAGDRAVINIVGNGKDNVGEDSAQARDRFVARGGTINGLVLGRGCRDDRVLSRSGDRRARRRSSCRSTGMPPWPMRSSGNSSATSWRTATGSRPRNHRRLVIGGVDREELRHVAGDQHLGMTLDLSAIDRRAQQRVGDAAAAQHR